MRSCGPQSVAIVIYANDQPAPLQIGQSGMNVLNSGVCGFALAHLLVNRYGSQTIRCAGEDADYRAGDRRSHAGPRDEASAAR